MSGKRTKADMQVEIDALEKQLLDAKKRQGTVIERCNFYNGTSEDNGQMMLVLARTLEANANAVRDIMKASGLGKAALIINMHSPDVDDE